MSVEGGKYPNGFVFETKIDPETIINIDNDTVSIGDNSAFVNFYGKQ
jgi:hypothetical protein